MTPAAFLDEVAHPNMVAALTDPDEMRAIVNAILTLDALAGILHAAGAKAGDHRMSGLATDDAFRDELAGVSDSYRVLRDAAFSLKHGEASDVVADSYRLLKRIVEGKLAGIDEHDRGTFYFAGPGAAEGISEAAQIIP